MPPESDAQPQTPIALSVDQPGDWLTDLENQKIENSIVKKIVLGSLSENDNYEGIQEWVEDLSETYPDLTHLYLWGIENLTSIPELPVGLTTLDVRNCTELTGLPASWPKFAPCEHQSKKPCPCPEEGRYCALNRPECGERGLECLDLAGCTELTTIPNPENLRGLRWFHVDGCTELDPDDIRQVVKKCKRVKEFTATGCTQLKTLDGALPVEAPWFWKLVLKDCSGLTELPDLAKYPRLQHLNLNGCSNLTKLGSLPAGQVPDRGRGLQYLVTEGCKALKLFTPCAGVTYDIRAVHLSKDKDEDDNVAVTFRSMQLLAESEKEAAELCMAKLLLLGSGRCGKTTIAHALQWYDHGDQWRREHKDLDPNEDKDSTQNIEFIQWKTRLPVKRSGEERATLRDSTVHIWDFGGQELYHNTHRIFAREGAVFVIAITDEEEHQTRVSRDIKSGNNGGLRDEVFRRQNAFRQLDYWIDYILNALQSTGNRVAPRIVVVYTGPEGDDGNTIAFQKVLNTVESRQQGRQIEVIKCFQVRFGDSGKGNSAFPPTLEVIKQLLGEAVNSLGVSTPQAFAHLADECDLVCSGCRSTLGLQDETDWHPSQYSPDSSWLKAVETAIGRKLDRSEISNAAAAIARFLNECGRVSWLRSHGSNGTVIVNPRRTVERIYELADPTRTINKELQKISFDRIEENRLIERLATCDSWDRLPPHKQQLLRKILDECNLLVAVADDFRVAVHGEYFPEPERLVTDGQGGRILGITGDQLKLEEEVAREWQTLGEAGLHRNESFCVTTESPTPVQPGGGNDRTPLGEGDYRTLLAACARGMNTTLPRCLFGDDREAENGRPAEGRVQYKVPWCRFWRDGFAMKFERDGRRSEDHEAGEDAIMLRVEWFPMPLEGDGHAEGSGNYQFFGRIFIQILAPAKRVGMEQRFMDFLKKDPLKSPLARFGEELRADDHPGATRFTGASHDWALRGFGGPAWITPSRSRYPRRHDVAFSYRQKDEELVGAIARALPKSYLVYHSGDDSERTLDESERTRSVLAIYDWLAKAKMLVVVATEEHYLRLPHNLPSYAPGRRNLHCPHELTQAAKRQQLNGGQLLYILVDSERTGDLDGYLKPLLSGFADVIPDSLQPDGGLAEAWFDSQSWIMANHGNMDDFLARFGSNGRTQHVRYNHDEVMRVIEERGNPGDEAPDDPVDLANANLPPEEGNAEAAGRSGGHPVSRRLALVHETPEEIAETIEVIINQCSPG